MSTFADVVNLLVDELSRCRRRSFALPQIALGSFEYFPFGHRAILIASRDAEFDRRDVSATEVC